MKKILNEDNQIHSFISSYCSGSDFLTSYGSGYGSYGSSSGSTTLVPCRDLGPKILRFSGPKPLSTLSRQPPPHPQPDSPFFRNDQQYEK